MKKLLLLITVMGTIHSSFAFTQQGSYRWRNDDGGEATATWKAPENTPIVINSPSETLRLRIESTESFGYNAPNNVNLEYSDDGITFTTLGTDPAAAFLYQSSTQVADGTATTDQLVTSAGANVIPFIPGQVLSSPPNVSTSLIFQQTEYEYVFRPGAGIASGTIYTFRSVDQGFLVDEFGMLATATTASALPVSLLAFTASLENGSVHLHWKTATEHNNDRFDVMQSADGKTWRCIATRKSTGNTVGSSYDAYDSEPNGISFYRLDQYDANGTVTHSGVRSVQSKTRMPEVSLFPNPMTGNSLTVHVPISGKAQVAAALYSATGAVVYRATVPTTPGVLDYTITLPKKPAPGMYYLMLQAQGLSRNVPVLVQ